MASYRVHFVDHGENVYATEYVEHDDGHRDDAPSLHPWHRRRLRHLGGRPDGASAPQIANSEADTIGQPFLLAPMLKLV